MSAKKVTLDPVVTEIDVGTRDARQGSTSSLVRRRTEASNIASRSSNIPWLGLIAIGISILSIFASFLVLFFINGRHVEDNAHLKPASWLSAIASINSICLHIALSDGLSIAFWYQSTKAHVTPRDLGRVWQHGTSVIAAFKAGHRFDYVALATIVVAVVPLNGFMLQSAIGEQIPYDTENVTIKTTSPTSLPAGWSGKLSADSSVQVSTRLSTNLGVFFKGKSNAFPTLDVQGCQPNATCYGQMPNVGFNISCKPSLLPFDLPPDFTSDLPTLSAPIFSSALEWNTSSPNTMYLRVLWKGAIDNTSMCAGNYNIRDCNFQVALMTQRVVITSTRFASSDPSQDIRAGDIKYTIQLDEESDYTSDRLIATLPDLDGDGVNTTIGGLAQTLAGFYNGLTGIKWAKGEANIVTDGFYSALMPTTTPLNGNKCNSTVEFGPMVDLADDIANGIRRMTFSAIASWHAVEHAGVDVDFSAQRLDGSIVYTASWMYWVASLVVTLVIVLAVSPVFWGFWTLRHKATMNPWETAMVFSSAAMQMQSSRRFDYSKRWTR